MRGEKDNGDMEKQLEEACRKGDLEKVKELIEKGADPNDSEYMPFLSAIWEKQDVIVWYLLSTGKVSEEVRIAALECASNYPQPLDEVFVNYLLQNNTPVTEDALTAAIGNPNYNVMYRVFLAADFSVVKDFDWFMNLFKHTYRGFYKTLEKLDEERKKRNENR